jgi:hypothetical protein
VKTGDKIRFIKMEEAVKMSNSLYEVRMKDKNKTKLAVSRKLKGNLGL